MSQYTNELRAFWRADTLKQARDELVTSPACPQAYTDATQDAYLADLLNGLPCGPNSVALDYGCGIGRVSRSLLRRGAKVVAVDISPEMLGFCRQYCDGLPGLTTMLSDGYGCQGVADSSMDGAVCLYCLQHLPSLEMAAAILADVHRVIKLGGWLVCQCTDHGIDEPDGKFIGVRIGPAILLEMLWQAGFADARIQWKDSQMIAEAWRAE